MNRFSQNGAKKRLFSELAESIGTKIRKKIIQQRNFSSKEQFFIRKISKIKTEPINPEEEDRQFWQNPYKTQKKNWKSTYPNKSFFVNKEAIDQYKKYELQRFKQKLKRSLEDIQSSKQLKRQMNQSRVQCFRSNLIQSRKQKVELVLSEKQLQAEKVRRILQKKKIEARTHKRKIELDAQFKKWLKQEQKQRKFTNLSLKSKIKIID